jgi:hypothetical protein
MANGALRKMSNCTEGLFISSLGPTSFLLQADPPVPAQSFLTKVRGVSIDQFGMGLSQAFCEDRVRYTDLFFMQDDLDGTVEVEVCHAGETSNHEVPLGWRPQYEVGIRYVDEPAFETELTEFEIFGDVSVMQLTVNHIEQFYKHNIGLAGFLRPELAAQPWLIVNYVQPGSYASEFIKPGSIVRKLNGHEVHTLEEFRAHFVPDDLAKELKVSRSEKSDAAKVDNYADDVHNAGATADARNQTNAGLSPAPSDTVSPASALAKEDASYAAAMDDNSTEPSVSSKIVRKASADRDAVSAKSAKVPSAAEEDAEIDEDADDDADNSDGADDDETGEDGEDDEADEDEADESSAQSFLAKRVSRSRKNVTKYVPSLDVVWTLETDDGEMYAVFFDETLKAQVMRAEVSQSTSLLSSAVLNAARKRNSLKPDQPFVRSMLESHSRQRARDNSVVDAVFAEIPVVSRNSWRPTIEKGSSQPMLM